MVVRKTPLAWMMSGLIAAQASSTIVFADENTTPQADTGASNQWQCVAAASGWDCSASTAETTKSPYVKAPLPVRDGSSATMLSATGSGKSEGTPEQQEKIAQAAARKQATKLSWVPSEKLPDNLKHKVPAMCYGAYIEPIITSTAAAGVASVDSPVEVASGQSSFADGVYTLSDNVLIKQGVQQVESNQAFYDQNSNITTLEGNVRYRQPDLLVIGDKAVIDLNQGEVKVSDSEFVVYSAQARGAASEVTKQGDNIITIEDGVYTTCPPGSNTWTLNSANMKLNPATGWGSATHATLNVKDVPVLYVPYFYFPIDDRRQSGFLYPRVKFTSNDGFDIATPYYFNLAPNYDLLLTPREIADRGLLNEAQFRYLTEWGSGDLGVGYIQDDKSDGGDSRSLTHWAHTTDLSERWSTLVDYTHVSDDDYFKDFSTSLNAKRSSHLNQLGQTTYAGDNWMFLGGIHNYQTIDDEIADNDKPFNRLPQFLAEGDMPGVGGLSYLWRTEYDYFYRDIDANDPGVSKAAGDLVEGHRYQASPGIRYELVDTSWGYITPQFSVNMAHYALTDNTAGEDNSISRAIPTTSIDAGMYFDRLTSIGGENYLHTLQPRLFYTNTPYHDQDDVPLFDTSEVDMTYQQLFRSNRFTGYDRVADDEHITIGMSNSFLQDSTGMEKLRIGIGKAIYLNSSRVTLESTDPAVDQSPLASELMYRFSEDWRMLLNSTTDSEDESNNQRGVNFFYNPAPYKIINTGYRYRAQNAENNDNISQSNMSFSWPVNPQWSALGQWRYDQESSTSLESLVGLQYNSCCWGLRLVARHYLDEDIDPVTNLVTKSQFDNEIYLQFIFKGLGALGDDSDGVVNESIYGYDYQNDYYDQF